MERDESIDQHDERGGGGKAPRTRRGNAVASSTRPATPGGKWLSILRSPLQAAVKTVGV